MTQVPLSAFLAGTSLGRKSPSDAFLVGVGAVVALQAAFKLLRRGFFLRRLVLLGNRIVRFAFAPIVQKEIEKAAKGMAFTQTADEVIHEFIPAGGYSDEKILALCHELHSTMDIDPSLGQLGGTVYHGGASHTSLINNILEIFAWTNPLHIDTFNAVRKMEAEVVKMVVTMFNGDARPDACGALTSGGTESICMAIKAYRDWARETKGITQPNIVVPVTAHPAFDKACDWYGIELIKVPVWAAVGRVDPALLETYITSNTIAIMGSAPNYPYGTIDPIAELAAIALRRGIGMHVDACLGGFVVQYMAKAGIPNAPVVDFRVPGVTTISCDTHKFGYAPKGTSTVLFGNRKLRRYMYFKLAEWPGGIYASPAAAGSKPGNAIAGTWGAMLSLGEDGYTQACRDIQRTLRKLDSGIKKIPHLHLLGQPEVCAIAFTSATIDIYVVNEKLTKLGWRLSPLQFPAGIQFSLTLLHTRGDIADRFLRDLAACVAEIDAEIAARAARGETEPAIGVAGPTMYGSQQRIGDRSILQDVAGLFLDSYYDTRHEVKEKK